MSKPILQFSERRTPSGIHLVGSVVVSMSTSLSHQAETRTLAEGYIISEITNQWVRLRGLYKLEIARNKLADNGFVKEGLILNVIDELIHELKEPQFIIKGAKQ